MKNFAIYLNKICKELDKKYEINSGGCCYVASIIAEELEKRNIPFSYVEIDGHYHCTILIGKKLINPMGCSLKEWDVYNISSKEIRDIYNNNDWNDEYDIRWNLTVKTIINSTFEYYDNNRSRFYIKT